MSKNIEQEPPERPRIVRIFDAASEALDQLIEKELHNQNTEPLPDVPETATKEAPILPKEEKKKDSSV